MTISMCVRGRDRIVPRPAPSFVSHRHSPPYRPAQECLTPATTIQVLEACKKGTPLPMTQWGSRPMNGQLSCEGPLGATTLLTPRVGPVPTRDMPKKVDPAAVKKAMMY
jgi:hypothetical protein